MALTQYGRRIILRQNCAEEAAMLSFIEVGLLGEDKICPNNWKSVSTNLGWISLGMMRRVHDGIISCCAIHR